MPTLDVEALIASQSSGRSNAGCQTCYWVSKRPHDERAKWVTALNAGRRWTHAAIYRAMKVADPAGPTPGLSSITKHRSVGHRP